MEEMRRRVRSLLPDMIIITIINMIIININQGDIVIFVMSVFWSVVQLQRCISYHEIKLATTVKKVFFPLLLLAINWCDRQSDDYWQSFQSLWSSQLSPFLPWVGLCVYPSMCPSINVYDMIWYDAIMMFNDEMLIAHNIFLISIRVWMWKNIIMLIAKVCWRKIEKKDLKRL